MVQAHRDCDEVGYHGRRMHLEWNVQVISVGIEGVARGGSIRSSMFGKMSSHTVSVGVEGVDEGEGRPSVKLPATCVR